MKLYTHVERVERELAARGFGTDQSLEVGDLDGLDQLHYHGTAAVRRAIGALGLKTGDRVIDVGAGLGGPARVLAKESGCQVTAIELQPDLNQLAESLTRRCQLADSITHHCGDFLDLQLSETGFDALVSWLTFLHIPRREALMASCYQCLQPGGRVFVEDFYARPSLSLAQRELLANEVFCSELPTMDEYRDQIVFAGFHDLQVTDMSDHWQPFVRQRLDEFRQSRHQYQALHGTEAYTALERFYDVIVGLFESGGLGGLRWTARRPA